MSIEQVVPFNAEGIVWDEVCSFDGVLLTGQRTFVFDFDYSVVILEIFAADERYERVANELADRLWTKLSNGYAASMRGRGLRYF